MKQPYCQSRNCVLVVWAQSGRIGPILEARRFKQRQCPSATAFVIAAVAALLLALLFSPSAATAHAFGARYDLPVPLWLWASGAGAVVLLSFVILASFSSERDADSGKWRLVLTDLPVVRYARHR